MLRPSILWTIIILNILILLNDIIGAFNLDRFLPENIEWIFCGGTVMLLLLIQSTFVYILAKFEITEYTLRTAVTANCVDILGISMNE